MRTRARGTVSPPPSAPALGSKRVIPSVESEQKPTSSSAQGPYVDPSSGQDMVTVETPRKAKRVRFSDPGPAALEHIDFSQSTGLTPHMRKTRLDGTSHRRLKSSLKQRRATLPPRLDFSPHSPMVEEMQFAPLRETLSARTRRRLRRSHMSEEMNSIEEEERDAGRARREMECLRAQEEARDDRIRELVWELESQRQLGMEVTADEEERVTALKAELAHLRDVVAKHQAAQVADAVAAFEVDASLYGDIPASSPINGDLPSPLDDTRPSPPVDPVDCRPRGDRAALEKAVERLTREAAEAKSALEKVRGELQHLGFARSHTEPEDILGSLRQSFRTARLELEYVLPGETAGGFEDGRLLLALIGHIRGLGKRFQDAEAGRNQHQQSETALRGQFNKCLERAEHLENRLTILEATRIELTSRLKNKQQLVNDMDLASEARQALLKQKEDELDDVKQLLASQEKHRADFEDEAKTQAASVDKLKAALSSYRDEIAKLEALVTEMDDACAAARDESAKQEAQTKALEDQRAQAEALLQHKEKLLAEAKAQAMDDHCRIAELEVQVKQADSKTSEAMERVELEVLQHARTKDILVALQADIEKANDRANVASKRDSEGLIGLFGMRMQSMLAQQNESTSSSLLVHCEVPDTATARIPVLAGTHHPAFELVNLTAIDGIRMIVISGSEVQLQHTAFHACVDSCRPR
ncbi:hypothetical protein FH972_021208 [Carpinus fangiana]|uniref:Uncharacterized protein n=1 Tax=Carpinus fangiana TaxID=176857 RepID=A0A5N6KNR5_9ROSI|nr:hypothetical protein FH972_021208 [Carpinus fangiana]